MVFPSNFSARVEIFAMPPSPNQISNTTLKAFQHSMLCHRRHVSHMLTMIPISPCAAARKNGVALSAAKKEARSLEEEAAEQLLKKMSGKKVRNDARSGLI